MTEKKAKPISLDLATYAVFSQVGAQPVAIMNEASSQLCRLNYCAGVVGNLVMIADVCANHESHDVQSLAGVFSNQLEPLRTMLDRLISDSEASGRGEP